MELRLLMRLLAVASVVLLVLSVALNNLLYIIALVIGAIALSVYRRAKPSDVKPYFYLAVIGTIGAGITFIVQGILGLILFINS